MVNNIKPSNYYTDSNIFTLHIYRINKWNILYIYSNCNKC